MSDIIGYIIVFLLLSVFIVFYKLLIGRRNGDQQIIDQLIKERNSFKTDYEKAQSMLDHLRNKRANKILNRTKEKFVGLDHAKN